MTQDCAVRREEKVYAEFTDIIRHKGTAEFPKESVRVREQEEREREREGRLLCTVRLSCALGNVG